MKLLYTLQDIYPTLKQCLPLLGITLNMCRDMLILGILSLSSLLVTSLYQVTLIVFAGRRYIWCFLISIGFVSLVG